MSLSARIAVGPSSRVALLAIVVATGGFVVAAATAMARWPAATELLATLAAVGSVLAVAVIVGRYRRTSRIVLAVSARAEIGVDGETDEHPWRLVEPTMRWPGFSVVAIAEDAASPRRGALRLALFDADVAPVERRAWSRFLLWSLRGGVGAAHS